MLKTDETTVGARLLVQTEKAGAIREVTVLEWSLNEVYVYLAIAPQGEDVSCFVGGPNRTEWFAYDDVTILAPLGAHPDAA